MGRVKDYIMQSGGDRLRFEALDTRGDGSALWSIPLAIVAIARIWLSAILGHLALIHVNMAERGSLIRKTLVILCARAVRIPVVLHLHAAEIIRLYSSASFFSRWLMRIPFRIATCTVVLGKLWRDWLITDLKINETKIAIVYNGVPAKRQPKPVGPFSFLFLGNLGERKGLTDFLHALALLPKEENWKAIIAGGGDVGFYRSKANELGLSTRTSFTGWVEMAKASALLQEASALVLPSYEEGLPLVILEALGRGTPVITTPVGAIPEVLDDRRTVLFVPPGSPNELAKRMKELMKSPALCASLAENAQNLYATRFTVDCFADNLFLAYARYCGITIERTASGSGPIFNKSNLLEERS